MSDCFDTDCTVSDYMLFTQVCLCTDIYMCVYLSMFVSIYVYMCPKFGSNIEILKTIFGTQICVLYRMCLNTC